LKGNYKYNVKKCLDALRDHNKVDKMGENMKDRIRKQSMNRLGRNAKDELRKYLDELRKFN